MRNIMPTAALLVFVGLSSAANALEPANNLNEPRINVCDSTKSFFPVFGANLGKTTEKELGELGGKDEEYKYYLIHGQKFWVKNGMFEEMYVTRPEEVPTHWRNMGFSWYLSYEQITNLFECLGFNVAVTDEPHTVVYKGKDTFDAVLTATKESENLEVVLRFKYGKGIYKHSENTLFKMKFTQLKQREG